MKTRLLILTGTIAAISCAQAQTPTLWYDFDSAANPGEVNNLGSTITDGVLTGGSISLGNAAGSSPGFSGGNALQLTGDDNSYVNSLLGSGAIGMLGNYTASAWVNIAGWGGDSMVFGQLDGGDLFLHDGIRNDNQHMGHWGADTTGSTNLQATFGTGNWFHLTWRQANGVQTMFINGNSEATSAQRNLLNASNVFIGTSQNGGGFNGRIDDVVVYNTTLKQNQIAHLAAGGDPNVLPAAAPGGGILTTPLGTVAPSVQPEGPSVPGGSGRWGVREIRGTGVDNLRMAYSDLSTNAGTATDGYKSLVYLVDDVSGNTSGHQVLIGNPTPSLPLTNTVGGDDDRVTLLYRAIVKVTTAGNYTFNNHGDDGFALRIGDFSWASSSGSGGIDFDDPRILSFNVGTGDTNTRGTIFLPVGEHPIEYITWEGAGGFGHQLSYKSGTFANDGDTQWRALGGPLGLGFTGDTVRNVPGVTAAGWTVTTSLPVNAPGNGTLVNIASARAALIATGTTTTDVPSINYIDPQTNGVGTGSFGGDIPFPRDTAADDDDYAMFATATLHIDEADTYRFATRGDDGGYIRIAGVSGWTIVSTSVGGYVADQNGIASPTGDTIWVDALTGDHNTVADIFLAPGDYTIEGLFFERGGGSWWEIGAGDADVGGLAVLAAGGNQNIPIVDSGGPELQIVPEPASAAMLLGGFGALLGFQRTRRRK